METETITIDGTPTRFFTMDGVPMGFVWGYAYNGDFDDLEGPVPPGGFEKSIRDLNGRVPICQDHKRNVVLGCTSKIEETSVGLYMEGIIGLDVPEARKAYESIRRRQITDKPMGLSLGFVSYDDKSGRDDYSSQRGIIREISITDHPAVPTTVVVASSHPYDVKAVLDLHRAVNLMTVKVFGKRFNQQLDKASEGDYDEVYCPPNTVLGGRYGCTMKVPKKRKVN